MAFMLDEYETIVGHKAPAMITGKPVEKGGSLGRDTATADGAIAVLLALLSDNHKDPSKLSAAIQGAGNAGAQAARLLSDMGMRITALADSKGTLTNADGLDVAATLALKDTGKSVTDGVGEKKDANAVITEFCDILVPAALEEQITEATIAPWQFASYLSTGTAPDLPVRRASLWLPQDVNQSKRGAARWTRSSYWLGVAVCWSSGFCRLLRWRSSAACGGSSSRVWMASAAICGG